MDAYPLNDPKLQIEAMHIAAAYGTKPLQWKRRSETCLTVILMDGRKIVWNEGEPLPEPPQSEPTTEPHAAASNERPRRGRRNSADSNVTGS